MTLTQLRELAAHHKHQARHCERQADAMQRHAVLLRSQSMGHASASQRRLAQFHASSAIHLGDLADAFATFGDQLSAFTSRPIAARDNSSIQPNTTNAAAAHVTAPEGAGAGA